MRVAAAESKLPGEPMQSIPLYAHGSLSVSYSSKFVSEDHVIMRGDLGDAEYLWAEHDRWEFLGLWVWCEELANPVADWFDDIDE